MYTPVAITGMGALSCLGTSVEAFWEGLTAARSGIGPIRKFGAEALRNPEAGEITELPDQPLPEWAALLDSAVRYALFAAREGVTQAGLPPDTLGEDTGILLATNFGGAGTFQEWATKPEQMGAKGFSDSLMSTATDALARMLGVTGPRASLSLSCSSGAAAIGLASDWIRLGKARWVIAGGYDALTLYALAGLNCLRTVTTEKLRPFDKNRSGTIFGEGAGIVVVESVESARERGAEPLALVRGWACNNNAHHLTAPQTGGEGLYEVMRVGCQNAGIAPEKLDYVNAHGTGTRYNDPAETAALHTLLGERAPTVPVSSIKAAISHTMGAAGALEAIATVQAIRTGVVPPTLNWQERDPECDLDYVPNQARSHPVACALSVSSGIGGNNAALVLERG